MKNPALKQLTTAIGKLSAAELGVVKKAVAKREHKVEADVVEADIAESVKECPHCGCKQLSNAGSKGGRKRFRCKSCGKSFNGFTGTPLAGLHNPGKFLTNAKSMVEGLSIKASSKKIGMSIDTTFRWRHRFLDAIEQIQPLKLQGVVEADETYFLESFKGQRKDIPRKSKKRGTPAVKRGLSKEQIPVLVARDRANGNTLTAVLPSRKGKDIANVLVPKLSNDTVLMSDGATAYRAVGKAKTGVEVRAVPSNPKNKTSGPNHINNVNAYDRRLKQWMDRFNGVATKYLPHYLGWHRWLDASKGQRKTRKFLDSVIKP